MIRVGQVIPDFEREVYVNGYFKKIKLSDLRGRWLVLAFYPADFTFVCPTELQELAELYPGFKKEGAEIISVSTDTKYVHLAWHDTSPAIRKVQYPMMEDPTGNLCKEFGTYNEEDGLSIRATFIIDPDGVVKSMDLHDNSIGRSAHEVLRKLQASIYVRENPGMVCPAGWHPGDEAIKKSNDLIGKI